MKSLVLYAALSVAQGLDVGTTCAGLRSGRFYETNPMLGSTCRSVVIRKAALSAGTVIAAEWLRKRGKKRLATTLVLIPTATGALAATLNFRVIWGGQE